jgi:predicted dienelactone hydrolase
MKWFYASALALIAFLVLGGFVLVNGKQPTPFPDGSESAARVVPGDLGVASFDIELTDESRATNPNGDFAGEPARHLNGTVWHPEQSTGAPFPLVVYSHGFTSTRLGGAYLAKHLVTLGYVVVAVDFPLTNFAAPGGPNVRDVINQPADVSFIIDTMLAMNATDGHALEGLIDERRIGVTGISLGGLTTTLVSFHPDMRDPRIGAALSIAGPTSVFNQTFFKDASIPFLMLAGDIDALVPFPSNAEPVIDKVRGAQLVSVAGASHTGFAGPAAPLRWLDNPDVVGCYMVKESIDSALEEPWYELIGTPEQGINHGVENELCIMEPLPAAINVLRQQMITRVVVTSFFESVFAPSQTRRNNAARFLSDVITQEIPEVSYQRAAR